MRANGGITATAERHESRTSDHPPDKRPQPRRVVLFADMLGFANLTEHSTVEPEKLLEGNQPFSLPFGSEIPKSGNELTRAFSVFHRSVERALAFAHPRVSLTAITFSDSVFIATKYPETAMGIAAGIVGSTLLEALPVRIGIAVGSFAAIRFRSDLTADGGDHAALFLGTGVVRAYQAEKCGIKGVRILLHPSVVSLFRGTANGPSGMSDTGRLNGLTKCAEAECDNRAGVHYELDYWRRYYTLTDERNAWRAIQDMWDSAPEHDRVHYEATASAVNRMRVAQGQPQLDKLRRRTLPRRRE